MEDGSTMTRSYDLPMGLKMYGVFKWFGQCDKPPYSKDWARSYDDVVVVVEVFLPTSSEECVDSLHRILVDFDVLLICCTLLPTWGVIRSKKLGHAMPDGSGDGVYRMYCDRFSASTAQRVEEDAIRFWREACGIVNGVAEANLPRLMERIDALKQAGLPSWMKGEDHGGASSEVTV